MPNSKKNSRKSYKRNVRVKNSSATSSVYLRKLTISSQSFSCQGNRTGLKVYPFLHLAGVWLEKAGFAIHDKVDVIVDDKLLIVKPAAE